MSNYQTEDFPAHEIKRTIGSAYSNRQNFGTKYYEDEDKVNQIKQSFRRGVSKKEIKYQLEEERLEVDNIEGVLDRIEEENAKQKFWTKSDKGAVKIMPLEFKRFLEDNGFYKFNPEGTSLSRHVCSRKSSLLYYLLSMYSLSKIPRTQATFTIATAQ